jgi:hypothetical protein
MAFLSTIETSWRWDEVDEQVRLYVNQISQTREQSVLDLVTFNLVTFSNGATHQYWCFGDLRIFGSMNHIKHCFEFVGWGKRVGNGFVNYEVHLAQGKYTRVTTQ